MGISSSGTGTPGGIPEFNLLSDQNSAATIQRAAMGIVRNLDTIVFTDIDKKALWKYDTSSSKPTLHPLEHMRIEVSESRIDDSWKSNFQDLLNKLPNDIRTAYEQNLLLPAEKRNMSLVALGVLLEGTAKVLNWIDNSVHVLEGAGSDSEIEARRELNRTLAQYVMTGLINESSDNYQALKNELLSIGANNPNFDAISGFLNQIGMAYSTLETLSHSNEDAG